MITRIWDFVIAWIIVAGICVICDSSSSSLLSSKELSVSEIQATGKTLFRALRNTECNIKCNGKKYRPVCGSDGVTYSHRCYLKRAKRCDRKRVEVVSKGECTPSGRTVSSCIKERDQAVKLARKPTLGVFIPDCSRDGTYSAVQCHSATGYCWCVTAQDGKPIRGTSIQGKKPNCRGQSKQRKTRGKKKNKRRKRKRCKTSDRQQFNSNLIKVFKDEYLRDVQASSQNDPARSKDPILNSLDKKVVEWKFSRLDINSDDKLRKKETRLLKRMVKKVIKPRACAKTFIGYCDLDKNKKIERKEWSVCLGVDINIFKPDITMDEHFGNFNEPNLTARLPGFEPPRRGQGGAPSGLTPRLSNPQDIIPELDDKTRSCVDEKANSLLQHKQDPNGQIYIPSCTASGKWDKTQCHASSEYCWCVDEETGTPIHGTSIHKLQPKCDKLTHREMKGCPFSKKRKFLTELVGKMTEEMNTYRFNDSDQSKMPNSSGASEQERAVRWKFTILDVNNNSKIDKRELKPIRKQLPKKKDTRKCRRNFIRYCDEDNDRKITLDEWIDCIGIKNNVFLIKDSTKRKGRNPFQGVLKPS